MNQARFPTALVQLLFSFCVFFLFVEFIWRLIFLPPA